MSMGVKSVNGVAGRMRLSVAGRVWRLGDECLHVVAWFTSVCLLNFELVDVNEVLPLLLKWEVL